MNKINFEKYAELALKTGINLRKDQCLQIVTGPGTYEYARAIAVKAYELGACYVRIQVADNELTAARVKYNTKDNLTYLPGDIVETGKFQLSEDWARIRIDTTEETDSLKAADSQKLATITSSQRLKLKFVSEALMRHDHSWLVLAVPGPNWAKKIYGLGENATECEVNLALEQFEKVWISIMRLDTKDPVKTWRDLGRTLGQRADALNGLKIDSLRFQSGKTDLLVGLARTHKWLGGPCELPDRRFFEPNLPTEEVFTTPDFRRTEGFVQVVKPVKVMETLVEDAWFSFEAGKVVDFGASSGKNILARMLSMDGGASFLGEVALVDVDSPINRSGLVFGSILFDENASCHIALGAGYPSALSNMHELETSEELKAAGCNVSLVHTDFMISTDETDVTGYTASGDEVPVIRNGTFVI